MLTHHITSHWPRLIQFILSLAIMLGICAIMAAVIYSMFYFFEDKPLSIFLTELTISILFFPLAAAMIHTFSARKHVLTIKGNVTPSAVAQWAITLLQQEGLQILSEVKQETVLAPKKRQSRLFNYWLGSELVQIKHTGTKVTIAGRYRHLESIEFKIRVGEPAFN